LSLLGVASALAAVALRRFVPPSVDEIAHRIGANSVDEILSILASSMLAVTTFTLSIMVQAYGSATQTATPRATTLLIEDSTTQNVVAVFLGSFLFALVGIVCLHAGVYDDAGRMVLFATTLGVIALLVGTLIRWFDHLTMFGRVSDSAERVEKATLEAMRERLSAPTLGCQPLHSPDEVPRDAHRIQQREVGYVRHLDIAALDAAATKAGGRVYVLAVPGMQVGPTEPVLAFSGPLTDGLAEDLKSAVIVGPTRTFDHDPRFGLCVLSEIASRALSPGINDPGTAIDVIGRQQRLLSTWIEAELERSTKAEAIDDGESAGAIVTFKAVHAPELGARDLMEDAFRAIGRDGAGMIEVMVRLKKALAALDRMGSVAFSSAAREEWDIAHQRAQAAMPIAADIMRLD